MSRTVKIIVIVISIFTVLIIGVLYFIKSLFSSFAHPEVTITKDFIKTNREFINGVTIEKIIVDSMGKNNYPVKYTVVYTTSCNIHHPANKPPNPPSKIEFFKPGKYFWDEDTIKLRYIHIGLSRESPDTTNQLWWLNKFGNHPICPMNFEQEQWYFITIGNPQVTGIFFYIDNEGKEHQYFLESGVSPI